MVFPKNRDLLYSSNCTLFKAKVKQWTIKGNFEAKKCLGQGSHGQVYVVQRKGIASGEQIVMKVSRNRGSLLPDDFIREFTVLDQLSNSPSPTTRFVSMLGVQMNKNADGSWRTNIFLPYYPCGSLRTFLRHAGHKLEISDLRGMCRDVLEMLEQLRKCNIIHRDLKADNIAVSESKRLYLIDFGSACEQRHRLAITGRFLTTATVRAPEVVCGNTNITFDIDTWAGGCVL